MVAPTPLAPLLTRLRSGDLALADHVEALCTRLEETEPYVRAFLPEQERHERLLAEAEALEERFPDPADRPRLYGVPVAVKDIIAVDGFETRAGSALPPDVLAMPEASAVTRLREAGALIVGKSVTTEFAYMDAGATANPHDTGHTPGGSSSGSAAAVAAGTAALALGSQTVGSVIRPAAFCGVVGFKPSYGRIATDGVLDYSPAVDHVGTFTADVPGAYVAAHVLLDEQEGDHLDDEAALSARHPTIGVPDGPYLEQAGPEGRRALEDALARLEAAGLKVKRVPALADIEAVTRRHRVLIAAEFADVHREWFDRYGPLYRAQSAQQIDRARSVTVEERADGFEGRARLLAELESLMDQAGIDVWACPPAPGPAPADLGSTGDAALNLPWTHAGMPAITVPCGEIDGLPVGLQLVGRFGQDYALLYSATRIERTLQGRDRGRLELVDE
ncbi:MAG: amidase [Dehalococcoidia bacterium]|nr:amidase [Dehalococcoidia bacterium]